MQLKLKKLKRMKHLKLTVLAMLIACYSFALTPITGILTVCKWDTTELANATPGGSWSSSDPSVGTIDAIGIVTALNVGTTDITYTVGPSYVTATVTVNFLPTITGISSIYSSVSTTWTNASPGGTWISANPSVATIDASTGVILGISGGYAYCDNECSA